MPPVYTVPLLDPEAPLLPPEDPLPLDELPLALPELPLPPDDPPLLAPEEPPLLPPDVLPLEPPEVPPEPLAPGFSEGPLLDAQPMPEPSPHTIESAVKRKRMDRVMFEYLRAVK
jgi:hypothetical protein